MSSIQKCRNNNYFSSSKCPNCGNKGEKIINEKNRIKLSKFMGGALRHFPKDSGISINKKGWVNIEDMFSSIKQKYKWATKEKMKAVISTDPKDRFEILDNKIRASYGHSIEISLEKTTDKVPNTLYHGTKPSNINPIMKTGLLPMERQEVHLSKTIKEARKVGYRHSENPTILKIDSKKMTEKGLRITKRGKGVYTTDKVPPNYISQL